MNGIVLQRKRRHKFIIISWCFFLAAGVSLVWWGVKEAAIFALMGLLAAVAGSVFSFVFKGQYPRVWTNLWGGVANLGVVAVAAIFAFFFLLPLPDEQLKLPRLSESYADPEHIFVLQGPEGWDYRAVKTHDQSGVVITPSHRGQYMGVNELRVMIMPLSRRPQDPDMFLQKFEASMQNAGRGQSTKKLFKAKTEAANLLLGGRGVWSEFEIRPQAAFTWISITQTTLVGIKNGEIVCSISAAGPTAHATLFKVICLGMYEKLKIKSLQNNRF